MALYDSATIGTDTNKITFNDYTTTPIYRVVSRAPQRRQLRELDIPIPFENGISDFETLIGQTAYVIEGVLYPGGESDYDSGVAALRKLASLEIAQGDVLSDDGYVPYEWQEFTQDKRVYLKVLYVQIVQSTRQGLVQPFRLICKIKDPTIFGSVLLQASTSTATPSASTGTAIYSFTYPIVFGASTYSVTAAATNNGHLPVYPIAIHIYGPVNTPKLTNSATGEYIQVANNLIANDDLSIAYDKDNLIVELNGNSVMSNVTSTSTFFKIQPGSNPLILSGSSISTGAYATLSYRHGWPLS